MKKKVRPLLQAVATAFPHAQVELWGMGATDEHRIGLKPLLRRIWAPIGQRPIATVQHRFAWRYLVGFVHPVLDRAGWKPTSVRLRVPDHVHLLFLPPYSPELQPAEHLWPLTNAALVNQHFTTIEDLEDAQFARCAALQQRPDLIRSTTCFHWWPKRIHKRRGPRRN